MHPVFQRWQTGVVLCVLAGACGVPPETAAEDRANPPTSEVTPYVPNQSWQARSPAQLGFDPARLQAAVAYAQTHETTMPDDPGQYLRDRFEGQPHQEIVGPTKERGEPNGLVIRHGYIAAEFGDTRAVDMTFSVTKSYLSTVAGLAHADGRIPNLDEPVAARVDDPAFRGRNADITWRHLLQQTSEWEGELFGKPDIADRREGVDRTLKAPGTFWEYNDVRVNLLAYALLHVWQRPLPEVLRERIMDPIGASNTWEWHGYETSWTEVAGRRVQSVSGGGHWGGGIWIDSRDHARFGLLFSRRGTWGGRELLPASWIDQATTPTRIQPNYGFMWWLNTDRGQFSAAPESSFFALGAGSTSVIWVDPEHDIVTVTRWVDGNEHVNEFMRLVLAAVVPD